MKYCTNCGAEIAEESKFCSNCGTRYEEKKTEYDDMWGAVLEKEVKPQEELDIKYEEEPYTDESVIDAKEIVFQMPTLQNYEMPSAMQAGNGNIGCSIASMVCGIVSLVCCCFWYLSIILAIVAIVLGIISIKKEYEGKGMAIAGLITGGIAIFALIVLLILGGSAFMLDLL